MKIPNEQLNKMQQDRLNGEMNTNTEILTSDKPFEETKKDFTFLDGSKTKPEPLRPAQKFESENQKIIKQKQNAYRELLGEVRTKGIFIKNPFDPATYTNGLEVQAFQLFNAEYQEARREYVSTQQIKQSNEQLSEYNRELKLLNKIGDLEKSNDWNNEVSFRLFYSALNDFKIDNEYSDLEIMTALFFWSAKQNLFLK